MNDARVLKLELRPGRHIKIGDDVTIELDSNVCHNVKVVFKAPKHVSIQRSDRKRKTYDEAFADDSANDSA